MTKPDISSKKITAFHLLLAIRDAQYIKGSMLMLLFALAIRSRRSKSGKFFCFPSYRQLELDTQLDIRTLKRAAKGLDDLGVMKRRVRHKQSNFFYIDYEFFREAAERNKMSSEEESLENWDPFTQTQSEIAV